MRGTIVGVLRGGPSREHEVSLATGHAVLQALPRERYTVRDIYIDREGVWHERGLATSPASVLPTIDVAIIALHGEYGEDGQVQKMLEQYGTPYTGSDPFASFVGMHKVLTKERARSLGINVPRSVFIEDEANAASAVHEIIRTYPQPVIVKPARWGSSVGVTAPAGYQPVHQAVTGLLKENAGGALVEERVRGTEATVGVVEHLRGEELYALPPVEIIASSHVTPGRFPKAIAAELEELAKRMHRELGMRHYSRSDFIVSPKGIYYLETNSLPGLTTESLMPKALDSVGISLTHFLEHILGLALEGGRR